MITDPPPEPRVALVRSGPQFGDIYLEIDSETQVWNLDGQLMDNIIPTRSTNAHSGENSPTILICNDHKGANAYVAGLLFHHSESIEALKGWAMTFGINELRLAIEDECG
jgi:hypothetical protein